MDIKTYKEKRIRSRYIIQSKLFLDVFYSLYDGVDSHQGCPVYVLKFHRDLVTPHFVDYCIQSLKDYLYQPIEGVFELMDFEFDGEDFYIFYKYQKSNFVSLELYLKTVQNQPDSSAKRYKLLLKVSRILYRLEQKQLVFANFSLNNIFVSKDEAVVLGPAKVQSLCLEYFISKVDELEGSIFLSPEFLRSFTVSTINDIYGFGILAYYMVTLHWPYTHKDSLFRLKQCFLNGPALCTDFNPKISDKLNFFIMKSIQLDPGKRWHSFRSIIGV
jgi:serine/threonine protein kinase